MATFMLDSKCCCCSLRCGSVIVGSFSMLVALIFMGLAALASQSLKEEYCTTSFTDNQRTTSCSEQPETTKMIGNLMAILSVLNAVEVIMSVGLIWGASKRIESWVTGWLGVAAAWILLHSVLAISYLFTTTGIGIVITIAIVGIFILGMSVLSMLTVVSYRKELLEAQLVRSEEFQTHILPDSSH